MAQRQAFQQLADVSDRVTMAPPRPRLERVTDWMSAQALDVLVLLDTDLVTWLTGYSRYYGGPSALVVDPSGGRVLVVLRDEVPVAERLADADQIVAYGERGFGLSSARFPCSQRRCWVPVPFPPPPGSALPGSMAAISPPVSRRTACRPTTHCTR